MEYPFDGMPGEESQPRTLYVGNLDPCVDENFILALFTQMGQCKSCKIIHEPGNDPYCFVEFCDHTSAASALAALNKRFCMGREMKVNWATSPSNQPKQDTSKSPFSSTRTSSKNTCFNSEHFHIFVGDLSPDIETHQLRDAFKAFGEISDCKIIRDPQTLKSKGYGFVSFVNKVDAETAINTMNGQWLGSRPIRTNWAARKPPAPSQKDNTKQLSYEEVYNQSSPTNCTVYCGGISQGLTEELMRKTFNSYGVIHEIRVFKDKGYAFIRFSSKESAAQAICGVHGNVIADQPVKCSWGKESNDPNQSSQPAVSNEQQQPFSSPSAYGQFYGNMGYWGYPYQNMAQSSYVQGGMNQWAGYNYQAYAGMNVPTMQQWGQIPLQPGQQQQQFNGQQQTMLGYPLQQDMKMLD